MKNLSFIKKGLIIWLAITFLYWLTMIIGIVDGPNCNYYSPRSSFISFLPCWEQYILLSLVQSFIFLVIPIALIRWFIGFIKKTKTQEVPEQKTNMIRSYIIASIAVYFILILCLAMYTMLFNNEPIDHAITTSIILGTIGPAECMTGGCETNFIPFLPLLIILPSIFILISTIARGRVISPNIIKKVFLTSILISSIIFAALYFI